MCVSGIGVISVFFNVTKADPPVSNPFFKFLDDKTQPIDLSSLMPIDFSLHSYVMGYVGTNTVPNCERG